MTVAILVLAPRPSCASSTAAKLVPRLFGVDYQSFLDVAKVRGEINGQVCKAGRVVKGEEGSNQSQSAESVPFV